MQGRDQGYKHAALHYGSHVEADGLGTGGEMDVGGAESYTLSVSCFEVVVYYRCPETSPVISS